MGNEEVETSLQKGQLNIWTK